MSIRLRGIADASRRYRRTVLGESVMRRIFRFSFERESYWIVALLVLLPLIAVWLFT